MGLKHLHRGSKKRVYKHLSTEGLKKRGKNTSPPRVSKNGSKNHLSAEGLAQDRQGH